MGNQNLLKEYKYWLGNRKQKLYSCDKERVKELKSFYDGKEKPEDSLLRIFFKWIKKNDNKIDTIILWGSYCRGTETDRSFNRYKHKGKSNLLSFGPSDIDALVIGDSDLKPPKTFMKYKILDSKLN